MIHVTAPITFLTPTFARDLERFCLQRESIERCGIDIPHVAVVNHEDLPRFRNIPHQRGLTFISTRDVLPRSLEARRKVWRISRKDYRYWITGTGIAGWGIQQLLKLAAPAFIQTPGIICLDSDAFFVRRVTPADFHAPDGRLHLYETTDDVDIEMAEWYAHSLRFFGQNPLGVPIRRFTHAPVPLQRDVLLEMQSAIQQRHKKNWMDAIISADRIMEYTTYGTFARHIHQLKLVSPIAPPLVFYYWWATTADTIQREFHQRLAATAAKIVLINSNMGLQVSQYRDLVAAAWDHPAGKVGTPNPLAIAG